jgi:hypothetical protein
MRPIFPVIIVGELRNDHVHHPCLKITRLASLVIYVRAW